jgi:hypothetical protein
MPKPNVTFETLRLIAESASGMRDQDLYFVVSGEPAGYSWQTDPVEAGDDTVVIHCAPVADPVPTVNYATIGAGSERQRVNLLDIAVPGVWPHKDPGKHHHADAVFWSISAVEKFLVPYYASVYGDQGPAYARNVMDAMLHPDADTEERTFAIAHLPSSEYVTEPYVPGVVALRPSGASRVGGGGNAFPISAPSARTNGSRSRYARSSGR